MRETETFEQNTLSFHTKLRIKQEIAQKACGFRLTTELSRQNSLGSAHMEFLFNFLVCSEYLAWVLYSSKRFAIVFLIQGLIYQ